jgi:hypothetical protein
MLPAPPLARTIRVSADVIALPQAEPGATSRKLCAVTTRTTSARLAPIATRTASRVIANASTPQIPRDASCGAADILPQMAQPQQPMLAPDQKVSKHHDHNSCARG